MTNAATPQTAAATLDAGAARQRMLISYAHPDDESFGLGGTIARYTNAGVDVHLICATNGDEGDIEAQYMQGYATKAEVRLAELHCAAEKLGIKQVHTFGYRDSGMMGAPANDHPDCLWQADQAHLIGQVVEVIRQVRPQVVVTFDPYGGYGHPDHIAIHRATVEAFHAAADPAQYPEQIAAGLQPYQPQKLYFNMFPRGVLRLMIWMARLRGQNPRKMGRNGDLDMQAVLDETLPSHALLDLRAYYDQWQAANACHASQGSPTSSQGGVMGFFTRRFLTNQRFYRAWPAVNGERVVERDLFEGVAAQ